MCDHLEGLVHSKQRERERERERGPERLTEIKQVLAKINKHSIKFMVYSSSIFHMQYHALSSKTSVTYNKIK